ncbi:MAG: hypothetical protein J2P49_07995 [Methylocapsa sp.]|nr:hypothetical protein [Methylocapsa sp.]
MPKTVFAAAALVLLCLSPARGAERQAAIMPDFSLEATCGLFTGHPRPLALCLAQEARFRGEVTALWGRAPDPGRGKCADLAAQSERGKYQVLSRCLRAALSEAEWKEAVGSIK